MNLLMRFSLPFWLINLVVVLSFVTTGLAQQTTLISNPPNYSDTMVLCQGAIVTYNDATTGATSWNWQFGGGSIATANTAGPHTVTYSTPGSYYVKLRTNLGRDSMLVIVQNTPGPTAGLNFGSGVTSMVYDGRTVFYRCASGNSNIVISVSNTTTGGNANTNYTIIWGDGTANNTYTGATFPANVPHGYTRGSHVITFIASNPGGCADTTYYELFLGTSPSIGFVNPGSSQLCLPDSITFPITNFAQNNPGTTYTVSFNDGTQPVIFNHPPPSSITHVFGQNSCGVTSGTQQAPYTNAYQGIITARNVCGSSNVAVVPIYVAERAQADFSISPDSVVCVGTLVTLTNQTDYGVDITPTTCDTVRNVIWSITPSTGWTLNSGTFGSTNGFVDLFYDPLFWTTGTDILNVTFNQPGSYAVRLLTGSSCGPDSMVRNICVNVPVQAGFTVSDTIGCAPFNVTTVNQSGVPLCGTKTYNWSVLYANPQACPMGTNGAQIVVGTANSENPTFRFNAPGLYTIRLITNSLVSSNGVPLCPSDTHDVRIYVKSKPGFNVTTPVQGCQNTPVVLTPTVNNCYGQTGPTYNWAIPGGAPASSTNANPGNIIYSAPGTYTITGTARNECGDSIRTANVTINQAATVSAGLNYTGCMNDAVTLNGSIGGSATTATWTSSVPGGTFTPSNTTLGATYTPPLNYTGTLTLTLTTNNPAGPCPAATSSITMTYQQSATSTPGNYGPICVGQTINLNGVIGGAGTSGTWSSNAPGGSFSPNANALNAVYTPPANYIGTIQLTLTSNDPPGACSAASATTNLVINALPVASSIPNGGETICPGQTTNITLNSTLPSTTYAWTVTPPAGVTGASSGSGGTIAQTLGNTTSSAQIVNYVVTPTANGCAGAPLNIPVTVRPTPIITPVSDITVCPGNTAGPVNFTSTPAGASFAWNNSNTAIGIGASGSGNISSWTAPVNNSGSAFVGNVSVVPTLNTCVGPAVNFNVTIQPTPVITNNPLNQTICSGQSFTNVVPTSNTPSTNFTWSSTSSIGISPGFATNGTGTITGSTLTTSGVTQGSLVYQITPTANSCPGTPVNYTIFVNPIPNVTVPAPQTVCSGAPSSVINLTSNVVGAQFNWTASGTAGLSGFSASGSGNIPAQTVLNSTTTQGTVTFTITPVAAGCSGTPVTYQIFVDPAPIVSFTPVDQTICSGSTSVAVNLSSSTPNATFAWTSNSPAGVTGATANGTNTIPAQTLVNNTLNPLVVTYTATATTTGGNACPGTPTNYTITVNPVPDAFATPNNPTICSGTAPAINLTSTSPNINFTWTVAAPPTISGAVNGSGTSINQVITNTGVNLETVTYTITPVTSGCPGTPINATVNVRPNPTVNPVSDVTACPGQTIGPINFVSTPAGATFSWVNPATGGSGTGNIPPFVAPPNNTNLPVTAQVSVTPTLNGCSGSIYTFNVTVNPTPAVTNTPLTQTICSGGTTTPVTLTSGVAGATFAWNSSSSNGVSLGFSATGTGNLPTQTLTTSGNDVGTLVYTITPTAGGCVGIPANYTYTVNPIPTVVLPPNQQICSGSAFNTVNFTSSVVPTTTYSWTGTSSANVTGYAANGTGAINGVVLTNASSLAEVVSYVVTPTALGCVGPTANYTITVQPAPTVSFSPVPQTICSNTATQPILLTSTTAGVTFAWTSSAPAGISGNTLSGTGDIPLQTLVNTTNAPLSVTYTATATTTGGLGCPGVPANYVVIVNPTPNANVTPINSQVCSGLSTAISISSSVANTTFNWTVNTPGTITGASSGSGTSINQVLSSTSLVDEVVTYTITPTANGCVGPTSQATVTVRPVPVMTPVNPISICAGQPIAAINFTSTPNAGSYSWSNSNTQVGIGASGSGNIPGWNAPANTTGSAFVGTVSVTPTLNGCVGNATNFTVTILPTPVITSSPLSQTLCSGTNTQPVALSANTPLTSYTWTNTSSTGIQPGFLNNGTGNLPAQTVTTSGTVSGTLVYQITPTASGCQGSPVNYSYTVNPTPTLVLPPAQTICSGSNTNTVNLTSPVANTNFSWTSTATAGTSGNTPNGLGNILAQTLTNNTTTTGTVTYTITPSSNGCNGTPVNYVITVNPSPSVSFSPAPQTICSGATTQQVVLSSTTPGVTYTWSTVVPTVLNGVTVNGTGNIPAQTIQNTTNSSITLTYTVTPQTSGTTTCPGTQGSYSIVVHPTPSVTVSPLTQNVCSGNATSIGLSGPVNGTTFSWTVNAPSSISGTSAGNGTSINQTLSSTSLIDETVNYTITPSANGCAGTPVVASVLVRPRPTMSAVTPISVCPLVSIPAINFSANIPGTQFSWVNTNPSVGIGANGNGNIAGWLAPANNGTNPITGVVTVTPTLNGCTGSAVNFNIAINPQPVATATPAQQVICSGNVTSINLSSSVNGTTFNWSVNSGPAINGATNGSGNTISQNLVNTASAADSVTYTITPTLGSCVGNPIAVVVRVDPVATITATPTNNTICSGGSINVSLSSSVSGASFTWTVSNPSGVLGTASGSGSSIAQTLTNNSNQPATVTYNVSATFNNCSGSTTPVAVVVNPIPTVLVNPSNQMICSGANAVIAFSSNVNGTTFAWTTSAPSTINGASGGNGSSINQALTNTGNAIETFTYTVVPTANSCAGSPVNAQVQVNPVVGLTANPANQTICSGQAVAITISANTNPVQFGWVPSANPAISGASSGTGASISQVLTNASNNAQQINYTVTGSINNCPGTPLNIPITINPLPQINPGTNVGVCISNPAFNLQGYTPSGGNWTGNGISNGSTGTFDPALAGIGTHTLTYTYTNPVNSCTNSATIQAAVNALPQPAILHDSVACLNAGVNFTNNSTNGTSFTWFFGDGSSSTASNPTHTYTNPGLYTIRFIATSGAGCVDSLQSIIRIITAPTATYSLNPTVGCAPLNVAYNNTSTGYAATYLWDFGNGTTSTTYAPGSVTYQASAFTDTTYYIQFTVSNLCGTATRADSVQVFSSPTARFGTNVNQGCSPLPINFINASFGGATSYLWDFGDGTTSTLQNPGQHTFVTGNTPTTFTITLTVSNQCGTSSYSDTVNVQPNTVNAFFNTNPIQGCAPLQVTFTNFSTGANIYNWDFGDGNTANTYSTTHSYLQNGTYTVRLIITNGCSYDTAFSTVNVNGQPIVDFVVQTDSLCAGDVFNFINLSPALASSTWNFGDGNTSVLTSPSHTFATGGLYNVMLIGSAQANGCTDTIIKPVFVKAKPTVNVVVSDVIGCEPMFVTFNEDGGSALFHQWFFGDGNTAVGTSPVHTFATAGFYNVSVVGSNFFGCTDTGTVSILVNPRPVADFVTVIADSCSYPTLASFNNTSTGALGYSWTFGNGASSTINNPFTTYDSAGTYQVILIANNQFNCADTITKTVNVFESPQVNFIADPVQGCEPLFVEFTNNTQFADSYWWVLGDGTISTAQNPTHTYGVGNYTVTLVASNANGCSDSLTIFNYIRVLPRPQAAFSISPTVVKVTNPVVELFDFSVGGSSLIYNMGDGNTVNFGTGAYIYQAVDTGTIIVQQIVTNSVGCTDTAQATIFIEAAPTLYVPNAFTPNLDGENDGFRAYGLDISEFEILIYDRWGHIVFESKKLDELWNGTYRNQGGAILKSDVYVWKIFARDRNDEPIELVGRVTLLN